MKISTVLKKLAVKKPAAKAFEFVPTLQQWICSQEFEKLDTSKHDGVFHPSALYRGCARAMAYRYLKAPQNSTDRDPRLQVTFEIGHGVHARLQAMIQHLAKARGFTFEEERPIPRDKNAWFIRGRIDGVLSHPTIGRRGLEIKTINNNGFKALWEKPQEAHIFQGNIYQGLDKLPYMHYLYVNKDTSAMKEFILPYNEELFEQSMRVVEDVLLDLQANRLPERCKTDCRDPGCQYLKTCWDAAQTCAHLLDASRQRAELTAWRPTFATPRT